MITRKKASNNTVVLTSTEVLFHWGSISFSQKRKEKEKKLTSLSLEFTRLSQINEDDKYFDAVQRVTNELDKA